MSSPLQFWICGGNYLEGLKHELTWALTLERCKLLAVGFTIGTPEGPQHLTVFVMAKPCLPSLLKWLAKLLAVWYRGDLASLRRQGQPVSTRSSRREGTGRPERPRP